MGIERFQELARRLQCLVLLGALGDILPGCAGCCLGNGGAAASNQDDCLGRYLSPARKRRLNGVLSAVLAPLMFVVHTTAIFSA